MAKNDTYSTGQETYAPTSQEAVAATGLDTLVESHDNDTLEARERTLAEFRYKNGLRVVFSYDEISEDYGLLQEGRIGESAPLVQSAFDTMLEAYLSITPEGRAIPEELLEEGANYKNLTVVVKDREISPECVIASQIELPITSPTAAAAGQTCFSTYYSWWNWHNNAAPGMAPKSYYSSTFGGRRRYAQSYIFNCTPAGSGSWLWARHRIYYKKAGGGYRKHFDDKVAPWHWQAKTKGSIKRYRRVTYSDGWNSSPSCNVCKYTREGRFRN